MMLRVILFLMMAWPAVATAVETCEVSVACPLGDRSYHLKLPDNWDGMSPMPVLIHFHGWQRTGALPVQHHRISGATRRRGVLLVAPNGRSKSWDFWNPDTDEIDFANDVLDDVARRFPIDRARIYVSGYSFGGAMAWRFACQRGEQINALLAISGSLQQDENCPEAPGEIRHVHGLSDTVMSFPMGPNGDVTYPVALWRRHLDCAHGRATVEWQARSFLSFERRIWNCPKGRVTLDLHPGGHFIPHGWIARQLDELLGLPNSYP